jgi:hypothetical protein
MPGVFQDGHGLFTRDTLEFVNSILAFSPLAKGFGLVEQLAGEYSFAI